MVEVATAGCGGGSNGGGRAIMCFLKLKTKFTKVFLGYDNECKTVFKLS